MTTLTPPRRRWLRFSLRTLLLFVLLIGSVATLWWNWGPWRLAFAIEEPRAIGKIFFSDDDSLVMFSYHDFDDAQSKWLSRLDVRETATGKQLRLLKNNEAGGHVEVYGEYAVLYEDVTSIFAAYGTKMFNYRTGVELPVCEKLSEYKKAISATISAHYVHMFGGNTIVRLPDFAPVLKPTVNPEEECPWLVGDMLMINRGKRVELIHVPSGRSVLTPEFPGESTSSVGLTAEVCEKNVLFPLGKSVLVIDSETGALLAEFPGALRYHSNDGLCLSTGQGDSKQSNVYRVGSMTPVVAKIGDCGVSPDGTLSPSEDHKVVRVYDTRTGSKLWERENTKSWGYFDRFSADSSALAVYRGDTGYLLADARTGQSLMDFSTSAVSAYRGQEPELFFGNTSLYFAVHNDMGGSDIKPFAPEMCKASVWKPLRPFQWYGPACLPEFWLTLLLAAALLWSFRRDRIVLKSVKP